MYRSHYIKKLFQLSAVLFVLAIIYFGTLIAAHAQERETIYISPATHQLHLRPGSKETYTVNLINATSLDRAFSLATKPLTISEDNYSPVIDENTVSDLQDWITFDKELVRLPGGQNTDIQVTVQVPATASPGSYQVAIFASDQDVDYDLSGSVALGEIGSVLFVDVEGDVFIEAGILEFRPLQPAFESLPVQLEAIIHNKGNLTIIPKGTVKIELSWGWDPQGGEPYRVDFNNENNRILRETTRRFQIDWIDERFRIGVYEATITFAYGPNNEVISAETVFVVLPWKLILAIVIVLIVSILLVVNRLLNKKRAKTI